VQSCGLTTTGLISLTGLRTDLIDLTGLRLTCRIAAWPGSHRLPRAEYSCAVSDATLDPEDNKIIVLARSARARNGTAEGAAVRDETGRTYSATNVALPSLTLSALQVAVAMAVSSGAESLEAAALVTAGDGPADADAQAVRDLGGKILLVADPDGTLRQS
jgi:hypothetical protein